MTGSVARLFIEHDISQGQRVPLTREQAHYLSKVLRLPPGAELRVFNGRDGEWSAAIEETTKRGGAVLISEKTGPQHVPPDLWLVFAPIKKERTDFIVEKATELGVSRIFPVVTDHSNTLRINRDRLQAHAVEAAEQCGGTFVPRVEHLVPLSRLLAGWPAERRLAVCDETLSGRPVRMPRDGASWAILIGPEGGFSEAERKTISAMPGASALSLGPRILRADTAAVSAITLWQAALGDWT